MGKIALITGITGQCGSYLAELLLAKHYEVHGVVRRTSSFNTWRIDGIRDNITLHYGDMSDGMSLNNIMKDVKPDEVYNLAAQSHVRVSFDNPIYTADVVGLGTLRLLEATRLLHEAGYNPRFYQASSSEMFGKVMETPQKETTPFYPRSPYGCAKVFAHMQAVNYREAYNMHVSCGMLFNNESERRGDTFVTKKIVKGVAAILFGKQKNIQLGNLDSKRDWGYAYDYVEAMWLMLQQSQPDDYVIATGETHSVREFLEIAFGYVGLRYEDYIEIDPRFYRPTEVDLLIGDASKARLKLNWKPTVTFRELVEKMVKYELETK